MKVFYADDDSDEICLFRDALQTINPAIECITASNGQEALCILQNSTVEIIFLDVHMPKLDGPSCLKEIKKDGRLKDIPVIMYSNNDDERAISYYTAVGAAGFLNKKAHINELREALRVIMAEHIA